MFLTRVTAKGYTYLYLKEYRRRENYADNKVIVYRFGRLENALEDMIFWINNFDEAPQDLIRLGATKKDLESWIRKIQTRFQEPIRQKT